MKVQKSLLLVFPLLLGLSLDARATNTAANVVNGSSDLTMAASFSTSPTLPGATNDVTFTNITYNPAAFTLNASENYGTLDDLDAQNALTVDNTSGTADALTLSQGLNHTNGATNSDFIFVATGANLSIGTASTSALGISLANSNGNIDNAGSLTIGSQTNLALSSSSRTLNFNGAGTTTVNGQITNGALVINGTVSLAGTFSSANVTVDRGGTFTETSTGVVGPSGTNTFTVNGGSASFAGPNTYHGVTAVEGGGALTLTGTGGINSASVLTLGSSTFGGGTLNYQGSGIQQFTSGVTINAGATVVNASGNSLRLSGLSTPIAVTRNVGSTVDFNVSAGNITVVNANTSGILGGWATDALETTWAVSGGNGTTTGNITGLATFSANTWAAGNNTNVTGTSVTPAASSTTNSLRFNSNGSGSTYATTLSGTNVITTGGILETSAVGNSAVTISGGTLAGAAGADLVVTQNNPTSNMTISSVIADNTSATGLTKSGAGILTLTGGNSFTGKTTVNTGSLLVGSGGSINSTSGVTVFGGATFGAATGTGPVSIGTTAIPLNLNLGATTAVQSNLQFNIYSSGADTLTVGALTLTAPSVATGTVLVTLNDTTSNNLSGTYTLMTWTSPAAGTITTSEFTLAGSALGEGTLSVSGLSLDFNVTPVPEPSAWVLVPLAAGLFASRSSLNRLLLNRRNRAES